MFNEYGYYIGKRIPVRCVRECTRGGQDASEAVAFWVKKLDFDVPRQMAIDYLARTGGWTREELADAPQGDINARVLWLACHDMNEEGVYLGVCE